MTVKRIAAPRSGDSLLVILSLVFLVMAVGTFVLGSWGLVVVRQQVPLSFLDAATCMVGLYVGSPPEWQAAGVEPPLSFQIAEVLGPLSTGYAAASAGAVLLTNQLRVLRARAARGHSIVCAGDRVGIGLARVLAEHRTAVLVAFEAGREGTGAALVRRVVPISGDPCDPLVLRRAGAARAAELFALADTDDVNASIVLATSAAARDRRHPLRCYALVNDSDLHLTLLARLVTKDAHPSLQLHLLDRHQLYACAVLAREGGGLAETTVVVGSGPTAAALATEIVRLQVDERPARPIHRLLLFGSDSADTVRAVHARWPAARGVIEVAVLPDAGALDRDLTSGEQLAVLVTEAAGDRETLHTGLVWLHHWGGLRRVVLCMASDSGLTSAFNPADNNVFVDSSSALRVYSPLVALADPEYLRRQTLNERLARRLHLIYRQDVAQGLIQGSQKLIADRAWPELSPDLQESNRAQAADLGRKLNEAGLLITPLGAHSSGMVEFDDDETERLAILEHERWMNQRLASGLTYGRVRTATQHPDLVPWDQLDETAKEKDRIFIRRIPEMLRAEGFETVPNPAVQRKK